MLRIVVRVAIALVGCLAVATTGATFGQAPPAGGATKLVAPSRALAAPATITQLPVSTKRPVLIYYANETAPDENERRNLETMVAWLESSQIPSVRYFGRRLAHHMALLPFVVDCEIVKLSDAVVAPGGEAFDLVVFTNRLAREGRFLYLVDGPSPKFAEGEFQLPKYDHPTAASYPLSQATALDAALTAARRVFDPKLHEFALVTKSHGSEEFALTTTLSLQTAQADRRTTVDALEQDARKRYAEIAQRASPIATDAEGERLLIGLGRGFWETHGPVYLHKADKIVVVDAEGAVFRTADGGRLVVDRGVLTHEKDGSPSTYADGSPVVVAGVALFDGKMTPWNWRRPDVLPRGRQAVSQQDIAEKLAWAQNAASTVAQLAGADRLPLAESAAAVAQSNGEKMSGAGVARKDLILADPRFGRVIQTPTTDGGNIVRRTYVATPAELPAKVAKWKSPTIEQLKSINELVVELAANPRPILNAPRLARASFQSADGGGASTTEAVLDVDKMDNPILGDIKFDNPILGDIKFDNPILGDIKFDNPILGDIKFDNPILGDIKFDNPILGDIKFDNQILGDAAEVGKPKPIGATKTEFWAVVKNQAEAGMTFRLIFAESCRSSLGAVPIQTLRIEQTPVERIWTSDARGLELQTINYDVLAAQVRKGEGLIPALDAELRRRHIEQHAE